jgi:hypothetical protein
MTNQTVYILGAGASRFAGFPLGAGLRSELDWVATSTRLYPSWPIKEGAKPEEAGRLCLKTVDHIRKTLQSESTDLELTLTLVDLLILSQNQLRLRSDLEQYDLKQVKKVFAQLITETFQAKSLEAAGHLSETAVCGESKGLQKVMKAWAERVCPGDIVVTFNWDVLHEMILWKARKWDWRDGYGFSVGHDPKNWSAVKILKLHGSCNWSLQGQKDSTLNLDHTDFYFQTCGEVNAEEISIPLGSSSDFGHSLIVPSYLKAPWEKPVLLSIWQQASEAIKTAEKIIVIGYSLPPADAPTRTMLSLALKHNESLRTVSVVLPNPDSKDDAHARWRDFCSSVGKSVQPIDKKFEEYVLGI